MSSQPFSAKLASRLPNTCKFQELKNLFRNFSPNIDFGASNQPYDSTQTNDSTILRKAPPAKGSKQDKQLALKAKIDEMHQEIAKTIQQKKRELADKQVPTSDEMFFKSMFGVFYKSYSMMINSDSDARFLRRVFENSKMLSDLNKQLLYFNMPLETILKERHLPVQLFPPPNSEEKLPSIT